MAPIRRPSAMSLHRFFIFLSTVLSLPMVQGGETNENYLYLKMKSEDRYPVQEYRADHKREPFFLSPDYENPRIVEFYAHWCPHCIQFKPQYIKFARKIMEVTEDLLHKTPIEVFAISCVPYNKVCLNHNVKGYPTVQLFMPHSSNGTIIERNKLHPLTVLRRFGISATDYKESPQQEDLQVAFPDHEIRKNIGPHFMHRSSKQVYDDAHLSLDFALRNSVFVTNSALEIQRQSILKDFLLILQKTFPTTDSIQPLVDELLKDFDNIIQSDLNLNLVMDKHIPQISFWSPACLKHGSAYTCGLWTMFHIVTIGVVEWNKFSPNPSHHLKLISVADTIRNYIEEFFLCEECRMHFMHEYDSCAHDRCNRFFDNVGKDAGVKEWRELPLWLYETHNGVNIRLRKERIERHEDESELTTQFEVIYPPLDACHSCWLSEGRWDDDTIYDFLRHQYWPGVRFLDAGKQISTKEKIIELGIREPSIHSEVAEATPTNEDEYEAYRLAKSVSLIATVIFLTIAFVAWHRKRQFDAKGYHKNR